MTFNFKAFPQPSCYFFLEKATGRQIDLLFWVLRYPVYCTGLELISKLSQNKTCNILHPKYTSFYCFPIICLSAIWKYLLSWNKTYLCHFWYLEGSWLIIIPNFCGKILLRACYSLAYFMILWKYKYGCIQKGLCDIMYVTFGYVAKM